MPATIAMPRRSSPGSTADSGAWSANRKRGASPHSTCRGQSPATVRAINLLGVDLGLIDELLENGGHFIAERGERRATFRPVSDRGGDVASFQTIVRRLRDHEGEGYTIIQDHMSSHHGLDFVDLVILSVGAG